MTVPRDEVATWLGHHRAPLVGFVLPLVNGDPQAAEDVVQETMLRGWQHSTELEPEKAGSWPRTVARNIAISAYHRRRRTRPPEVPLDENTLPRADDDVDRISDAWLLASLQVATPTRTLLTISVHPPTRADR